jgi:hypothetical protein
MWRPICLLHSLPCQLEISRSSTTCTFLSVMEEKLWNYTYLYPRQSQNTRLLILQPLKNFVGIIAVDFRLLHQRKRDSMVQCTKFTDCCIVFGLLTTELGKRSGVRTHLPQIGIVPITWLHGNPRMTKFLSLYLSCRAWRPMQDDEFER